MISTLEFSKIVTCGSTDLLKPRKPDLAITLDGRREDVEALGSHIRKWFKRYNKKHEKDEYVDHWNER